MESETRKTLEEVIKRDLMVNNIAETLDFNQARWCRVIHVADSPSGKRFFSCIRMC